MDLDRDIRACRLCAPAFRQTVTAHEPRPVVWFAPRARILIAGQAPGARVHASGRPFTDRSGDRLRDWTGMTEAEFYDQRLVAIVPMAFCFPGNDAKGGDLPPPAICAETWRARVLTTLSAVEVTILFGGAAMRCHLGHRDVTAAVTDWRAAAARRIWPLPHPSWRNTGWLRRNPWFEAELLPDLRAALQPLKESRR